jgi:ketosteroid isomerase-like protein
VGDTDIQSLLARIDRLESKDAIRELVTTYAIACDEHDMPRLTECFTEDACFDSPNGAMIANGRADIVRMFEETFKIRGPAYHWTHDVTIQMHPTDPNLASGLVLSHAETSPNGVVSIAAMRYQDDYRREADQWRFAHRVITFLYYVPAAEYSESLNRPDRVIMGGERHLADYPENLACWQDFVTAHGPLQV